MSPLDQRAALILVSFPKSAVTPFASPCNKCAHTYMYMCAHTHTHTQKKKKKKKKKNGLSTVTVCKARGISRTGSKGELISDVSISQELPPGSRGKSRIWAFHGDGPKAKGDA